MICFKITIKQKDRCIFLHCWKAGQCCWFSKRDVCIRAKKNRNQGGTIMII